METSRSSLDAPWTQPLDGCKEDKPVVTQIFDSASRWLDDDAVFAVKSSLMVNVVPLEGDPLAKLQLEYKMALIPNKYSCKVSPLSVVDLVVLDPL